MGACPVMISAETVTSVSALRGCPRRRARTILWPLHFFAFPIDVVTPVITLCIFTIVMSGRIW